MSDQKISRTDIHHTPSMLYLSKEDIIIYLHIFQYVKNKIDQKDQSELDEIIVILSKMMLYIQKHPLSIKHRFYFRTFDDQLCQSIQCHYPHWIHWIYEYTHRL